MKIGLPLPYLESKWLEDGNRQYHESGTDETNADGFFVTFVHTLAKVQKISEKMAPVRHFLLISSHILDRSSQTRVEYPSYLEG